MAEMTITVWKNSIEKVYAYRIGKLWSGDTATRHPQVSIRMGANSFALSMEEARWLVKHLPSVIEAAETAPQEQTGELFAVIAPDGLQADAGAIVLSEPEPAAPAVEPAPTPDDEGPAF